MSDSPTPPLLDGLNTLEQQVIDAARRGGWAKPGTMTPAEDLQITEDSGQRVRAELIRELLMGRRGELDPCGLRIRRMRVVGQLDLDHVTAITGLTLHECALPDGMRCVHAQLREVNLSSSHIAGLNADEMRTNASMSLDDTTVTGTAKEGAIRLSGAHIGGKLELDRAMITNNCGPALYAESLRTDGLMSLEDATLCGAGESGTLCLPGAHVGGKVRLNGAKITNNSGLVIQAEGLHTDGSVYLTDAVVTGTSELSAVRLVRAHIGGQLHLVVLC